MWEGVQAAVFIDLARASVTCRSTDDSRLRLGRASHPPKAQKETTETSHSHFFHSGLTGNGEYLSGFKNPVAFPIFIYLVPPAEAYHEPSSYVLRKTDRMTVSTPQLPALGQSPSGSTAQVSREQ